MLRRKGWTADDVNWHAWRVENTASAACACLLFFAITGSFMATLLTLTGTMQGDWAWVQGLIPLGIAVVLTFLLSAYPDPVVRLCLRIVAGPRTDTRRRTR